MCDKCWRKLQFCVNRECKRLEYKDDEDEDEDGVEDEDDEDADDDEDHEENDERHLSTITRGVYKLKNCSNCCEKITDYNCVKGRIICRHCHYENRNKYR